MVEDHGKASGLVRLRKEERPGRRTRRGSGQVVVEDHAKASGLDLRQHHGAQAVGLCGVVTDGMSRMGLEEGHR